MTVVGSFLWDYNFSRHGFFFPLAACLACSDTMRDSLKAGGFQISIILILPVQGPKYVVSSAIPSNSVMQLKKITKDFLTNITFAFFFLHLQSTLNICFDIQSIGETGQGRHN